VPSEESPDVLALQWLQDLGLALLSEWETLAFLYRHSASLGSPAEIARLIGYEKAEIGAALQRLEVLGLVRRSRVAQGVRFYQFSAPAEASRRTGLLELMTLAESRPGRLLLLKHLKRPSAGPRRRRNGGLRLA